MPSLSYARALTAIRKAGTARVIAIAFPLFFLAYILSNEVAASRALHASSFSGVSGDPTVVPTTLATQRAADDAAAATLTRSVTQQRRWSGRLPSWCASLIRSPRPWRENCRRSRLRGVCRDGAAQFFGEHDLDFLLWTEHWRHLPRLGRYVDIAATEPVAPSNTYFYDRCLGWDGVCVEAHPSWHTVLARYRSCAVMPACNRRKSAKNHSKLRVKCLRTAVVLRAAIPDDVARIDMLNLDVRDCDALEALSSIDWGRTKINVLVIESVTAKMRSLLDKLEYRVRAVPSPGNKSSTFDLGSVFLRKDVIWGKPV